MARNLPLFADSGRRLLVIALGACGMLGMEQAIRAAIPVDLSQVVSDSGAVGSDQLGQAVAPSSSSTAVRLPGSDSQVKLTPHGTYNLHVADMPLATVLRLLSLEGQRNIVTSPAVSGNVTVDLYDVTLDEALQAVLTAKEAGYREIGSVIYVYSKAELEKLTQVHDGQTTRVFHLNYITAADAKTYITPMLGEEGVVSVSPQPDNGISSEPDRAGGQSSASNDFIIVTAPPAKISIVSEVLAQVDIRPQQVLVEATVVRAQLNDENALGIDFTIVGGVDLEELGGVSHAVTDLTLGNLPQDRFELFNSNVSTDFRGDVPPGGISIGVIKDHVAMFLRALEEVTDTVVLANPKVLVLNKQRGQVIVGRRDGYLTTTVTETQAVQTVEFLETGTQLIFRPFIGRDGYVRIELHPEDSVGVVNAQGLPTEQTTEVTTNVLVRDGHTVVIGGLFREQNSDLRRQVPGVGNIPGLGQLFRSNRDTISREEVIILLTIHVVKDAEAYAAASDKVMDQVEASRVGLREGLMWHGRERRARSEFRRARELFEQGNIDGAQWHNRMALHCNHRLMPAMELDEQISGKQFWRDDRSGIGAFLTDVIESEEARRSAQEEITP